jgi:Meiotically Up-regulated Gene 113 (MUG113) protein
MVFPEPISATAILRMDEGALWVSVSYCAGSEWFVQAYGPKPITRYVYATRAEAYKAKAQIDEYGCGGGCKGWHVVEKAFPREKHCGAHHIERKAYARYGGTIPDCFLLSDERARRERKSSQDKTSQGTAKVGVVYLIQGEGMTAIKIGHGTDATTRLKQFQIGCPVLLKIIREIPSTDCAKLERTLHQRYKAYKVRGEWFELPDLDLVALLQEPFV